MTYFLREINQLASMHLYWAAAKVGEGMGLPFNTTYRIIFGKAPKI